MILLALLEFNQENMISMLAWYVILIIAFTLHEAGHAFAAWKLGDPTAFDSGQVTINPIPHIEREPFGTILVPIVTFWLFGFMMGWASAPYNPHWANRYPWRAAVMILAGPLANLLLAIIGLILIRVGFAFEFFKLPVDETDPLLLVSPVNQGLAVGAAKMVSIFFSLNIILFLFNLVPLPPLDGSRLVIPFLSNESAHRYQAFIFQPMVAMMGIIVAWNIFPPILWKIFPFVIEILYYGYR